MNNLEKLKKINPNFYQKIKLKYLTNTENIKTSLDNINFEHYRDRLSSVSSIKELKNIEFKCRMRNFFKEELKTRIEETKKSDEDLKKNILNEIKRTIFEKKDMWTFFFAITKNTYVFFERNVFK